MVGGSGRSGRAGIFRSFLPSPLVGEGGRDAEASRTGEGSVSADRDPSSVVTAQSRCKASAFLFKNGGQRPPMDTFSHKGRREGSLCIHCGRLPQGLEPLLLCGRLTPATSFTGCFHMRRLRFTNFHRWISRLGLMILAA